MGKSPLYLAFQKVCDNQLLCKWIWWLWAEGDWQLNLGPLEKCHPGDCHCCRLFLLTDPEESLSQGDSNISPPCSPSSLRARSNLVSLLAVITKANKGCNWVERKSFFNPQLKKKKIKVVKYSKIFPKQRCLMLCCWKNKQTSVSSSGSA